MLPPLVGRCPDCGHVNLRFRFEPVSGSGPRRIECPRCGHRFEPVDDPLLG
jgi:DNA-directed RNA polymerase subunit RPC12/RpoP